MVLFESLDLHTRDLHTMDKLLDNNLEFQEHSAVNRIAIVDKMNPNSSKFSSVAFF